MITHFFTSLFSSSSPRRRLVLMLACLMVLLDSLMRSIFIFGLDQQVGISLSLALMGYGIINDIPVVCVQITPLMLWLILSGGTTLTQVWWRYIFLTLLCSGLLFGVAVEYSFWDEFTSRFNHIAIDYVLFPGEVATNIWQSYNVPAFVAAALLLGAGIAWPLQRFMRGAVFSPLPWLSRLWLTLMVIALAGCGVSAAIMLPAQLFGERVRDEIAANSHAQLVRAFATAHLDYDHYYKTLPTEQANKIIDAEYGRMHSGNPQRDFTAVMRRDRPLDVVVVLEESLGSEFVGRLGGRKPNTPGLDRWSEQGLLLTNLVANGNRTVRGLEGVLCSFLPLPGDSVWKRNKSENVATIARVLSNQGYLSEFFYGGAGIFDGMKPFALANGWQRFIEDGVVASDFPPDAFRTAWGAADEYVFERLLQHQRAARGSGTPFFGTLLTTSNHKPFLTPHTKDAKIAPEKLTQMLLTMLGIVIVTTALVIFVGRYVGRVQLILLGSVLVIVYGIWMGVKIQPKDSRENAVRYADHALSDYLDKAAAEGFLQHTVVLIVGDHGARVYGSAEIPAASYRIPGLILAPEERFHGKTIDELSSQVDLVPTLLSIAGIDYRAPFFGRDLLQPTAREGRAWLIHNRDIGLLTDQDFVVLGLRKSVTWYRRSDRDSDSFQEISPNSLTPEQRALSERAQANFQEASRLYEQRAYRLEASE
jgi:phosphoglycerol transferase MdoB-like AlkP superfamily enzyme